MQQTYLETKQLELLSVVIPVYNEAKTLETCITNLIQVLTQNRIPNEIIIIESNSTDNSREIVKSLVSKFDIRAYYQEAPLGKGNAVRLGIEKSNGEIVSIFDADLEYDPNDLIKLITPITSGQTSFVLGTRHKKGEMMRDLEDRLLLSIMLNLGHKFFTVIFNFLFNSKLTDPFTMYKVFRKKIFDCVILKGNAFDLDLELVAKSRILGVKIIEILVNYKSRNYSEGKKVNLYTAPLTWLIMMTHCRFQKNRWYIDQI
jgi:glycosyltransferase involved in cell wall biosynthesis